MRTKYLTFALALSVLFTLGLKPRPPILWDPVAIDETLEIGDVIEIDSSFTAQYAIQSAYLFVEPKLQQFITLDRTTFSGITPGVPNDFKITIYVPIGTDPKEFKGRIHLKGGLTYKPPLSIGINVIEPPSGTLVDYTTLVGETLNPILHPNLNINSKLFLGLVATDAFTGEVIGEIAESWKISTDGLTYTFTLRDDIYWTDGVPVTAQDVKFTYDAVAIEALGSPYIGSFSNITTVTVIDEKTLEIVFSKVDCAGMLRLLVFGILPSHRYSSDFSDIASNPLNLAPTVTNGPFKFMEWIAGDHITLVDCCHIYR